MVTLPPLTPAECWRLLPGSIQDGQQYRGPSGWALLPISGKGNNAGKMFVMAVGTGYRFVSWSPLMSDLGKWSPWLDLADPNKAVEPLTPEAAWWYLPSSFVSGQEYDGPNRWTLCPVWGLGENAGKMFLGAYRRDSGRFIAWFSWLGGGQRWSSWMNLDTSAEREALAE